MREVVFVLSELYVVCSANPAPSPPSRTRTSGASCEGRLAARSESSVRLSDNSGSEVIMEG